MSEQIIEILMKIERELGEVKATGLTTLEQAKKTNGRVTCLEGIQSEQAKMLSRHNGVLIKWEENEETSKKDYRILTRRMVWIVGIALLIYIFRDLPQITNIFYKII